MRHFRLTVTRHDVNEKKILSHDIIDANDLVEMWFQLGLIVLKIQATIQAENANKYREIVEGDIPF